MRQVSRRQFLASTATLAGMGSVPGISHGQRASQTAARRGLLINGEVAT
jgi:hypothetical protein